MPRRSQVIRHCQPVKCINQSTRESRVQPPKGAPSSIPPSIVSLRLVIFVSSSSIARRTRTSASQPTNHTRPCWWTELLQDIHPPPHQRLKMPHVVIYIHLFYCGRCSAAVSMILWVCDIVFDGPGDEEEWLINCRMISRNQLQIIDFGDYFSTILWRDWHDCTMSLSWAAVVGYIVRALKLQIYWPVVCSLPTRRRWSKKFIQGP